MNLVQEVFDGRKIELAPYVFRRLGPVQEHNYLCAVCRRESAVIETWWGVLQPCRGCQRDGYKAVAMRAILQTLADQGLDVRVERRTQA